jgi:Eco57I restriction-modification methylase
MRIPKSAYELRRSQVDTPVAVVELLWRLVRERRTRLPRILDLGAGDGRFSVGGLYENYEGVEIDCATTGTLHRPPNITVRIGCAFEHSGENYDACIGNPPYVRHHDLELTWKQATADRLETSLSISFDKHANLYLYFLCLALTKSKTNGLVALVIPYEWVSRPSAAAIRRHIRENRWNVSVYRFESAIFPKVLTTASITIVDKKARDGVWKFHDVRRDMTIVTRRGIGGSQRGVLPYFSRGDKVWARRGLSPGSQDIFILTDGERIHAGLRPNDVVPCVTTLRSVPRTLRHLNVRSFRKHFVDAGQKCWLIRCRHKPLNKRIRAYLDNVPVESRKTYTCLNQNPWYAHEWMPIPQLLFHSAFTAFGPKVLVNSIEAQAIGSVYGICADSQVSIRRLHSSLLKFEFENRVVAYAKQLKKIEVKQLNAVLTRISAGTISNGKASRKR